MARKRLNSQEASRQERYGALQQRLKRVQQSLEGMSAYAGNLLEQKAALEQQVQNHLRTIHSLKQSLDEAETMIVKVAGSDIGGSFTGRPAPIQKSLERQPKDSLPDTAGAASPREVNSGSRETPGNAPVVDPASPPASWSNAEK